jgi:uncharacterized protein DUF6230
MTVLSTVPPAGPVQGRVRWRRFAAIFIPAFLAIVVVLFLAAQGAIGVGFAISGTPFTVKASDLSGTGFEQWGSADADIHGTLHPVFVSSFNSATLASLCQSVSTPFPGPFANLVIKAGGGGTPASASNLVVDAQSLTADSATFNNINIGVDPNSFTNPKPSGLPDGTFGQSADSVDITNANQQALATSAGTFTLPGLSIVFSSTGC